MAQWFSRTLVRRAREHPLAFLSGFAFLSLNVLELWLLLTSWGYSSADLRRALVGAVGVLAFTFLLPLIWTVLYRRSAQTPEIGGDGRQGDARSVRRVAEEMRPSMRVRRGAYVAWGVLLLLGFAQLVLVISRNSLQAGILTMVVMMLNYFGLLGVFLVGLPLVRRQR